MCCLSENVMLVDITVLGCARELDIHVVPGELACYKKGDTLRSVVLIYCRCWRCMQALPRMTLGGRALGRQPKGCW